MATEGHVPVRVLVLATSPSACALLDSAPGLGQVVTMRPPGKRKEGGKKKSKTVEGGYPQVSNSWLLVVKKVMFRSMAGSNKENKPRPFQIRRYWVIVAQVRVSHRTLVGGEAVRAFKGNFDNSFNKMSDRTFDRTSVRTFDRRFERTFAGTIPIAF